jgi:hypothetical protein
MQNDDSQDKPIEFQIAEPDFRIGRPPKERLLAEKYLLEHPNARDKDVVEALGITAATVTRARRVLIARGQLEKRTARRSQTPAREPASPAKPKKDAPGLLTGGQLIKKAEDSPPTTHELPDIDLDSLSDEETRKRIQRDLRRLAFGLDVNNDTKLAAMQLWFKIKDFVNQQEIGPGKPKTRADAITRLRRMFKAVGFEIAHQAFTEEFLPKKEGLNEGQLPTHNGEIAPSDAGISPAPGSSPDIRPSQDSREG